MNLIGYGRVSRVAGREGDSFISPRIQREQVERWAEAHGHTIIDWLQDLDESGGKWDRPAFQEALRRIENREADGVAVAKLDRFARSLTNALRAIERIDEAGGELVSIAENFDTSTPIGRAMLRIALVFAELERERISEAAADAREQAVRRGVHISNRVVLGYRRRQDRRLEPDPDTAPVVREMFARRGAGESWLTLTEWLNEVAPREGGRWINSTVAALISNRVYLGETRHGEFVNASAHEPIVSRAQWELAQGKDLRIPRRSGSLLAGVLRCDTCGRPMTRSSNGRVVTYACQKRSSDGRCERPVQIVMDATDRYVEQQFLAWARSQQLVAESTTRDDRAERAIAALEQAEAELAAYRDANLLTVIGRDAYVGGLRERQRAIDSARVELADVQAATVVPFDFDIAEHWDGLELSEKRRLLAAGIDAIHVAPSRHSGSRLPVSDRLRFVWRGSDGPDVLGVTSADDGEQHVGD